MSQNVCIHYLGFLELCCSFGNKLFLCDIYCLHEITVSRKSSLKLLSREGYSVQVCTNIFPDIRVPLFHNTHFILASGREMLLCCLGFGVWVCYFSHI